MNNLIDFLETDDWVLSEETTDHIIYNKFLVNTSIENDERISNELKIIITIYKNEEKLDIDEYRTHLKFKNYFRIGNEQNATYKRYSDNEYRNFNIIEYCNSIRT